MNNLQQTHFTLQHICHRVCRFSSSLWCKILMETKFWDTNKGDKKSLFAMHDTSLSKIYCQMGKVLIFFLLWVTCDFCLSYSNFLPFLLIFSFVRQKKNTFKWDSLSQRRLWPTFVPFHIIQTDVYWHVYSKKSFILALFKKNSNNFLNIEIKHVWPKNSSNTNNKHTPEIDTDRTEMQNQHNV